MLKASVTLEVQLAERKDDYAHWEQVCEGLKQRAEQAEAALAQVTKERDEALARPSQHEGAHATCWAEVERLQAALAARVT
jgi:chromosome segregation ATPase